MRAMRSETRIAVISQRSVILIMELLKRKTHEQQRYSLSDFAYGRSKCTRFVRFIRNLSCNTLAKFSKPVAETTIGLRNAKV